MKDKLLHYKGKPLVRSGNTLYYGDMKEPYVIMIQIVGTKKVGDLEIANKVSVQLMLTDPTVSLKSRIVKKVEKDGIYTALDIGYIWLDRALSEKEKRA